MVPYDFIRNAVAALAERDRALKHFGALGHRYRLNAQLSESEVTAFEQRHGIRLPEDYRGFLIRIGNGGAGPYYGVFKLGEMDGLDDDKPWKEGEFVGILREPWPHRSAWNLPREELIVPDNAPDDRIDAAMEQLDRKYWAEAIVTGAFPICHHGCALRDWLVVTGPEAGQVWYDARVNREGLRPYERANGRRLTFVD
jgi:hypothetical protein